MAEPIEPTTPAGSSSGTPAAPAASSTPPAASRPTAPASAPDAASGLTDEQRHPWLNERLTRTKEQAAREERQKLLKELGIEDPDKFKTERAAREAEYAKLQTEAEERRRAEMTEIERYKADVEKYKTEMEKYKSELETAKTNALVEQQERAMGEMASRYVRPECAYLATAAFAKHAATLTDAERAEFDDDSFDKWCREFVKKHPEMAAAKPVVKRPAGAPVTAPVTTQRRPADTTAPGVQAGRTFKPGQANSATKAEFEAEKRRRGLTA